MAMRIDLVESFDPAPREKTSLHRRPRRQRSKDAQDVLARVAQNRAPAIRSRRFSSPAHALPTRDRSSIVRNRNRRRHASQKQSVVPERMEYDPVSGKGFRLYRPRKRRRTKPVKKQAISDVFQSVFREEEVVPQADIIDYRHSWESFQEEERRRSHSDGILPMRMDDSDEKKFRRINLSDDALRRKRIAKHSRLKKAAAMKIVMVESVLQDALLSGPNDLKRASLRDYSARYRPQGSRVTHGLVSQRW